MTAELPESASPSKRNKKNEKPKIVDDSRSN